MLYRTDASFVGMTGKTINACRQVVDGCHSTASDLSSQRRRVCAYCREEKLPSVVPVGKLLLNLWYRWLIPANDRAGSSNLQGANRQKEGWIAKDNVMTLLSIKNSYVDSIFQRITCHRNMLSG
jgi:hypothetical protein